jgi:hypothetical protein
MTQTFKRLAAVGLAAAALTGVFANQNTAEAHCGVGCGVAAGILGGAIIGTAIAGPHYAYYNGPRYYYGGYGYGYGYRPWRHHYWGPRYYDGPYYRSCWRERWYDRWGDVHVRRVCR